MITKHRLLLALALSATLASGATQAAGLMDSPVARRVNSESRAATAAAACRSPR